MDSIHKMGYYFHCGVFFLFVVAASTTFAEKNAQGLSPKEACKKDAERLKQDLSQFPQDEANFSKLGAAWLCLGENSLAQKAYDKAILKGDSRPSSYTARGTARWLSGAYEQALLDHDKALSLNQAFAPAHNNRGLVLESLKRWDEALASYQKAIDHDPDRSEGWANRGILLYFLARYDEALLHLSNAIEKKNRWPLTYACRGHIFAIQGNLPQAKDDLLFSRKEDQGKHERRPDPDYYLGLIALHQGYYDEALLSFRLSLKRSTSKNHVARVFLGEGITFLRKKDPKHALESLKKAERGEKKRSEVFYHQALAFDALGRRSEAIEGYRKTLAEDPHYVNAVVNLSGIFLEEGKTAEAEALCSQIPTGSPRSLYCSALALFLKAQSEPTDSPLRVKHADKSIALLRKAIPGFSKQQDLQAESYFRLSQILQFRQLHDAARVSVEKAIALSPNTPAYQKMLKTLILQKKL